MTQIVTGVRKILSHPFAYNFLQRGLGANAAKRVYIDQYIRPKANDKILDIGCGTADILNFLPDSVNYYGIDISSDYIEHAKREFGSRGTFLCNDVNHSILSKLPKFDIVVATALLHHINDDEVAVIFDMVKASLKENGRMITLDCCYTKNQSRFAKLIISKDRGQNVRTPDEYEALARSTFKQVKTTVRHDLLRIPYTHAIMECE